MLFNNKQVSLAYIMKCLLLTDVENECWSSIFSRTSGLKSSAYSIFYTYSAKVLKLIKNSSKERGKFYVLKSSILFIHPKYHGNQEEKLYILAEELLTSLFFKSKQTVFSPVHCPINVSE